MADCGLLRCNMVASADRCLRQTVEGPVGVYRPKQTSVPAFPTNEFCHILTQLFGLSVGVWNQNKPNLGNSLKDKRPSHLARELRSKGH